jgi:hypothetical protein
VRTLITYETPFSEVQALLLKAVKDLRVAQMQLTQRNYGLANDYIEAAIEKLPMDSDQGGILWEVWE